MRKKALPVLLQSFWPGSNALTVCLVRAPCASVVPCILVNLYNGLCEKYSPAAALNPRQLFSGVITMLTYMHRKYWIYSLDSADVQPHHTAFFPSLSIPLTPVCAFGNHSNLPQTSTFLCTRPLCRATVFLHC